MPMSSAMSGLLDFGPLTSVLEDTHQGNQQLFFAKVSNTASEDDISSAFQAYGVVLDVVIFQSSQNQGRHKGCGLVTMSSHAEAAAAIAGLDNQVVWPGCSRPMTVTWMDPALQDPARRGALLRQDVPPHGCDADAMKLFVGNIPMSCTEEQLLPIFQAIGPVAELGLIRDKLDNTKSKGCAFVWYKKRRDAERAIAALNLQHVLPDPTGQQHRPLVVRSARYGVTLPSSTSPTSPFQAPTNAAATQAATRLAMQQLLLNLTPTPSYNNSRPQSSPTLLNSLTPPPTTLMQHSQRPTVISSPFITPSTAPTLQFVTDSNQLMLLPERAQSLPHLPSCGSPLPLQLVQPQPSHTLQQLLLSNTATQSLPSQLLWAIHSQPQPQANPLSQYLLLDKLPASLEV